MNAEIKERWIAALESGEYQKGQSRLRNTIEENQFTYCCLGVLCDIHQKETGKGHWNEFGRYVFEGKAVGERDYLPKEVREWAEMGENNSIGSLEIPEEEKDEIIKDLEGRFYTSNLASINDIKEGDIGYDPTFSTVIGYIKKYF